ncbi:uncharacterized protein [Physcomitrium patens]|uniref:uncharacterized protein n=1 Tax=Physcomitrium patens TaxID=3218 RepID=UPI000D15AF42|nr:uncharacterized protein LOC112281162 [Physcomitrium patens]|eukprot:XP_024373161.1 uncharacterized protein LOC112281162 [Physcomitrella patens]
MGAAAEGGRIERERLYVLDTGIWGLLFVVEVAVVVVVVLLGAGRLLEVQTASQSALSFQDHSAALFWLFLQAWVMAMGSVWQCEAAPCWVVRNWTFLKLECRLMNECAQSVVCLLLAVWIVSSLLKINRTLWEGGFG